MTTILAWNLENYSLLKADPESTAGEGPPGKKRRTVEDIEARSEIASETRDCIQRVVATSGADIFIVLEVTKRTPMPKTPAAPLPWVSEPAEGAILLLTSIRDWTRNDAWYLVPPLVLGNFNSAEAVAVFYNSAVLEFTGPAVYGTMPGTPAAQSLLPGPTVTPLDYPAQWNDVIAPQAAPAGAYPNLNVPACANAPTRFQMAGQCAFLDQAGQPLLFSGSEENRPPFLTRFWDLANQRSIYITSVHTSPNIAAAAIRDIGLIQPPAVGANDVSLVIGDFNWDVFYAGVYPGPYAGLIANGYGMLLKGDAGNEAAPVYWPYCTTHLLPNYTATPAFAAGGMNPTANAYPRLGYMGTMSRNGNPSMKGALDNAFLFLHGGAAPVPPPITVANEVIGAPYAAGPPNAPLGQIDFPPLIRINGAPIPAAGYPNPDRGVLRQFWGNQAFGCIRNASDHLAIAVTV